MNALNPHGRPDVTGLSPFWCYTAAGLAFDFDNPRPEMIDRRALAWQLSLEGRWANNLYFAFSVAQHSLIVASLIEDPAARVYGLLHDAAEAFTRDLPTPFKLWLLSRGADVPALERRILYEAVFPYFQLPAPTPEINAAVDRADAIALATEYRDVVKGKGPEWTPKAPPRPGKPIGFRHSTQVEEDFLGMLDVYLSDARAADHRRVE